ncbi:TetR/AcrR family transcriptional regulator [Mesorhizobium sp. B2-4-15]|uniref:TetR/AcrR family transcriptional regulator n=1 Tax=Mesorhizobium sp. B2-4-15 TaxID=2589934 RepID=UPI00114EC3A2|nr:TetR/AcrR family transcriptional regulator [Mesorhizobium sp. B2-4-15]TPK60923.1 TetR/AcrR family transcriptional regulator [Mesorhizobium sp. B2-4-15]
MPDNNTSIRPRSSLRKGRSDTIEHVARQPSQNRSMARFEKILDASEELLQAANIEDISFYDIARQASISPASINYLFPTMAALRIELSRRYLRKSSQDAIEAGQALARRRDFSWQTWLYDVGKHARAYFNDHRPVSEACLGPILHRESRRATIAENDRLARALVDILMELFVLPEIPGLTQKFAFSMEVVDGLWSRSYTLHGYIDDESFQESMRMQTAYLRMFLPEVLPVSSGDFAMGSVDPALDGRPTRNRTQSL